MWLRITIARPTQASASVKLKRAILTEMKKKTVPPFDELMNPTLQALKRLGGSASIDELVPEIVRLLDESSS
jgi:hypothetical protein